MLITCPTRGLLAILAFAAAAASQASLQVDDYLTAGDSIEIVYSNPAMAGQVVTLEISNASRDPKTNVTVSLEIELDAQGVGRVTWVVEDWFQAEFTAPGAPPQTRDIN